MKIQLELNGPEPIVVNACISPIEFSTGGFHVDWESLATLREVEPQKNYPASTFRGFLPPKAVAVGEHWEIDLKTTLQLLKQLAEKPRLKMRIGNAGGQWASLRAYNDRYAEIVFRIHTIFVLKDGYFTPSQFAGRLTIDRHTQELTYLEELSMGEARLGLARQFYRAQLIEWVQLDEAMEMAKSLDRPIHVVSADGTFMDESC